MIDELLDVVNERDEVTGRQSRRRVHQQGLRHRAVHVLVFNASGHLFLQKRSATKDTFPGAWDSSASGHVDAGESYEACALREIREELGVTLDAPLAALFKLAACPDTGHEFVWVYRGQSEGPFRLPPEEIECGDWFSPVRVTRWLADKPSEFAPAFRLIWDRLRGGEARREDGE